MIEIKIQGVATSQTREGVNENGKPWGSQIVEAKGSDGKIKRLTYWFKSNDNPDGKPLQEYQHYEFKGRVATRKDSKSGYFYNDLEVIDAKEL